MAAKMNNDPNPSSDLTPVQHPVIKQSALPEAILQLVILGVVVGILRWVGVSFETTLLVLLVLGFTLNTMNLMASTVSQNVHLAEIRDLLIKRLEQ